ncbi:hypothetical protein ACFL0Q_05785 [Thermodesulfobacteriota bacterium]
MNSTRLKTFLIIVLVTGLGLVIIHFVHISVHKLNRNDNYFPHSLSNLNECKFEQSRPLIPVVPAWVVSHMSLLREEYWPNGVSSYLRRKRKEEKAVLEGTWYSTWRRPGSLKTLDQYLFQTSRSATLNTHLVQFENRSYFFSSHNIGGSRVHWLGFINTQGKPIETIISDSIQVRKNQRPLMFDVKAFQGRIYLVYAAVDGLFQLIGIPEGNTLKFTSPKRIRLFIRSTEVYYLQLACTDAKLHLFWSEERSTILGKKNELYYSQKKKSKDKWRTRKALSKSLNRGECNVATHGKDIFIVWSDSRFKNANFNLIQYWYSNKSKALITRSSNEGKSFSRATAINKVDDEDDLAYQIYLALMDNKPIVLWTDSSSYSLTADRKYAILSNDIKHMISNGTVTWRKLEQAYMKRMNSILIIPPKCDKTNSVTSTPNAINNEKGAGAISIKNYPHSRKQGPFKK